MNDTTVYEAAGEICRSIDRLTEAVKGITPESEGDARSVAAGLVRHYDRWIAKTPAPQRLRDAEGKLAAVIRDLRAVGG